VAEKRRLRKQWQCSRCPDIKSRLNRAIKDLKRLLDAERNNGVQKYLQGLDATAASDYSLWKATRKLKQPKTASPPLRNEDGNWDRSDYEKAVTFANHLQRVFLPHPYEGTAEHEAEVMRTLAEPPSQEISVGKFRKTEVIAAVKKLNHKKAPGYDLITGRLLKELPDSGFSYLTHLYNAVVRCNYVPPQWKVAQIKMILKTDKAPEEPKSYRPISLLPIPSKVLESLLSTRLLPALEENDLVPEHQFGFRRGHGTIDQVHRLTKFIRHARKRSTARLPFWTSHRLLIVYGTTAYCIKSKPISPAFLKC